MRRLELHARKSDALDMALKAIEAADPIDVHVVQTEQRDRMLVSVFLRDDTSQALMDNLQTCFEDQSAFRITLHSIQATVPELDTDDVDDTKGGNEAKALREELYAGVNSGATLDRHFLLMVMLSTVVAAAGLNSDSAAGVIGAMVIAPLLGPILAFGLGAALGDRALLVKSLLTLGIGVVVALLCAVGIALIVEVDLSSRELMSRAEVRIDGMALAIAAGAAAALSMAKGQNTALVGVMVAAALLPPIAAVGLFAGQAYWEPAGRAALLLLLNVASLVFASLVVFYLVGIRPRGWIERENAKRAVALNLALSVGILALCVYLIAELGLGERLQLGMPPG